MDNSQNGYSSVEKTGKIKKTIFDFEKRQRKLKCYNAQRQL